MSILDRIDLGRVVTALMSAGFLVLGYAMRADAGIYSACLFLAGGSAHHAAGSPGRRPSAARPAPRAPSPPPSAD